MAKSRKFLTGAERAEFEHVYGPLPVDQHDPRFVVVDDETSEKIDAFNAEKPSGARATELNKFLGRKIAETAEEEPA